MKTTFRTPTGCRITVEPSPTRSFVWLRWTNPAPGSAPSCIIPIPLELAGNIAGAIEAIGTMIEEGQGARPELPAHALSPDAEADARQFAAGIALCGELQS